MKTKLSGTELNCWIAEKIFGFEWRRSSKTGNRGLFPPDRVPSWFYERADGTENVCFDHPSHVPFYTENLTLAHSVLEEIRKLILKTNYCFRYERFAQFLKAALLSSGHTGFSQTLDSAEVFLLYFASPRQICEAVYFAVEGEQQSR